MQLQPEVEKAEWGDFLPEPEAVAGMVSVGGCVTIGSLTFGTSSSTGLCVVLEAGRGSGFGLLFFAGLRGDGHGFFFAPNCSTSLQAYGLISREGLRVETGCRRGMVSMNPAPAS